MGTPNNDFLGVYLEYATCAVRILATSSRDILAAFRPTFGDVSQDLVLSAGRVDGRPSAFDFKGDSGQVEGWQHRKFLSTVRPLEDF